VDIINSLSDYGIVVTIFDPLANPNNVKNEYDLITTQIIPNKKFDAIVLGVSHNEFKEINLTQFQNEPCVIYDVKNFLTGTVDGRL
jgi:UDP-N-acetyl-D-galactosamine dehydrogenase